MSVFLLLQTRDTPHILPMQGTKNGDTQKLEPQTNTTACPFQNLLTPFKTLTSAAAATGDEGDRQQIVANYLNDPSAERSSAVSSSAVLGSTGSTHTPFPRWRCFDRPSGWLLVSHARDTSPHATYICIYITHALVINFIACIADNVSIVLRVMLRRHCRLDFVCMCLRRTARVSDGPEDGQNHAFTFAWPAPVYHHLTWRQHAPRVFRACWRTGF